MADELKVEINPDLNDEKSDLDLLNDDTKIPEKEEEVKLDDKEDILETEEEDEDKLEVEEDNEDEETEEEELPESKLRPSLKTMTDKFPDLPKILKAFPQLRDAYYREGKFTQIFPTVEDATQASELADTFQEFNEHFINGSSKELLAALSQNNPDSLKKLATNFLPTLNELNADLFYDAIIPSINNVIRNLHTTGEKEKDNNMMGAAKILSKFLHGTYDIPIQETKKDPEIERERKKLDDERNTVEREKYDEFSTTVHSRANRLMTKAITDGLDPEGSLTEFTKSAIIEKVIDKIGEELEKDPQHNKLMEKLWKGAQQTRYKGESADRLLTAFLSRAKRLIPEIRAKFKAEALGTSTRKGNGIAKTTKRDATTGTKTREVNSSKIPAKTDRNFWKQNSDRALLD